MKLIKISAIWCPSCIIIYNIWNEIKKKYPNYEYIEYDYDEDEDIVKEYNVGTILPVIIIIKDNKEVTRIIGEKSKKEIFKIVDDLSGE